jgi:hypothetical protein
LRHLADDDRNESGVGGHLSLLRVIDIVLWHWTELRSDSQRS